MMTAKVSVRTATGVTQVTRIEVLLHKVLELALKGNPRALSIILTLYDGAVPEPPLPPSGTEEETDEVVLMLQEKAHQFLTRAVAEK